FLRRKRRRLPGQKRIQISWLCEFAHPTPRARTKARTRNVIQTHEHAGEFMRPQAKAYLSTILIGVVLVLVGVGFIREGPKHIPAFAAYTAGCFLILLTIILVVWLVRNRQRLDEYRFVRIADPSSRNAVSFSSARTTKRFPLLRIALELFLIDLEIASQRLFRCERGDDFFEARVTTQWIP